MKITAVQGYACTGRNSLGYVGGAAMVRVETDAGLAGHGETLMGLMHAPTALALVAYYAPLLVGRDPADIDGLWQYMFDSSVLWGRCGAAPAVLGAIEIALWDLAGQVARQPCWKLLAERMQTRPLERIPLYASLGAAPLEDEALRRTVRRVVADGFRGLKLGFVFRDADGKLAPVRRKALADRLDRALALVRVETDEAFMIAADGHMGGIPDPIGRDEALDAAKAMERYGCSFLEEPLSYLDPDGYAWLRERTSVRIAGGESLSLFEGFRVFTERGALDVLQPDMNFVGGYHEGLRLSAHAREHDLAIIPHAWCMGPGFLANLHFAIAAGAERLEAPPELTDLQRACMLEPPRVVDGFLKAPRQPGLGIRFDPDMANEFPFQAGLAERGSGLMDIEPADKSCASLSARAAVHGDARQPTRGKTA